MVEHRVHVAGADGEQQARASEGSPRFAAVPIGLRDNSDTKAICLQHSAENRSREAGVIYIGVAGYEDDVDFVPSVPTPGRRNFFARTIAVSIARAIDLPCPESPFTLTVEIRNDGIERFDGAVRLHVSAAGGGSSPGDTIRVSRLILLPPAACDSVKVRLRAPRTGAFSAVAFLGGAPDDWPGDDTARVELRTSPGEIVVNEIMYRPRDGESEWVELFSAGGCNLAGWTMCDATGSRRLIAGGPLVLPPGGYLVLARDSAAFSARYPRCPSPLRSPAGGWPVLNDGDRDGVADRVTLRDIGGAIVESVAYRDLLGDERGRSIERISEDACSSAQGGIWHRSAARDGATPGFENSMRLRGPAPAAGLRVEPNPFSPSRHGVAVITGSAAAGHSGFRVRIFSIAGIEIRRIYGERGGARAFSCRWDGRNDAGAPMPSGVYVCLVEYMGTGGGVCGSEKICIVVARP